MATTNVSDHRAQGDVVLERFAKMKVPTALKPHVQAFKREHTDFEAAAQHVEASRTGRDDALAAITLADDALDASLGVLADKLVGAGLGKRTNAFAGYSAFSPARLQEQAYATEVKESRALCAKVKKARPPAEVLKAVAQVLKNADAVDEALRGLTAPQAAYAKALAARDGLLPGWTKAYDRLKRFAAAQWFEDQGTYRAVFAVADLVQKPVRRTRAKKGGKGGKGGGAPPATT